MAQSRTDQIMDIAEDAFRRGGYDAISFRDIAAAIGVKSASVHYHFPQKSDLGQAVIARYAARVYETLGAPDMPDETPPQRMARLTGTYRAALSESSAACLCAVFGGVSKDLPEPLQVEIRQYYKKLRAWTDTALVGAQTALSAAMIISLLVGAIILAAEENAPEILAEAERTILAAVQ